MRFRSLYLSISLLFFSSVCSLVFSQDFTLQWQQIDSLINIGLLKTARDQTDMLYNRSKTMQNIPAYIKSLQLNLKILAQQEEDALVKMMEILQKEIADAQAPQKQILHSFLGETFQTYYEINRHKFEQKIQIYDTLGKDIHEWSPEKFRQQALTHYTASLNEKETLISYPLDSIATVLIGDEKMRKYRPSLFDLLAHRALKHIEAACRQEKNRMDFAKYDNSFFTEAETFVKLPIGEYQIHPLLKHALQIFQQLLSLHLFDAEPSALANTDLERLLFVYENIYGIANKQKSFIAALHTLRKQYQKHPFYVEIACKEAEFLIHSGEKYKPLISDLYKWDKKKAMEICEDALQKFPDTPEAINCQNLLQTLQEKYLSLTLEEVNLPEKHLPALLSFKNVQQAFFRIVKIPYKTHKQFINNERFETLLHKYISLKPLKEWSLELPDDGDAQMHNVEIKLPPLPKGNFILIASTDPAFLEKDKITYAPLRISEISFIHRNNANGKTEFFVQNRETGHPIKDLQIRAFRKQITYRNHQTELQYAGTYVSDENGFFSIGQEKQNFTQQLLLEFSCRNDTLLAENIYRHILRNADSSTKTTTHFFTDRALYRPGQLLYFKGIVVQEQYGKFEILPDYQTTISFYDANRQKIADTSFITNEFGSFSGTFSIPDGLLNGRMHISNETGNKYFSVEEYKRPNFEILFDTLADLHKISDTLTIRGRAKSFSGTAIAKARINYTVSRSSEFPFWKKQIYPYPVDKPVEIASGKAVTNEMGEFYIHFLAKPDYSLEEVNTPIYNFQVEAEATDINGETQMGNTAFRLGEKNLIINVDIPETFEKKGSNFIPISACNLNGQKQQVNIIISIYKLADFAKPYIARNWQRPDKFILKKDEFYKYFPKRAYGQEDDKHTLATDYQVFQAEINTREVQGVDLPGLKNWENGFYKIILKAKDPYDEQIEEQKIFTLYEADAKKTAVQTADWFSMLNSEGEPGQKAGFVIGTQEKNTNILYEIHHQNKVEQSSWLRLDAGQKKIEIPILEKYRGNFNINLIFIKNNRVYSHKETIKVPFSNKKLAVSIDSFPNNMQPGLLQEWKIKIAPVDSTKKEILAFMYDASLDSFVPNALNFSIFKPRYSDIYWQSDYAFENSHTRPLYARFVQDRPLLIRDYERLNWIEENYGFSLYGSSLKTLETALTNQAFDSAIGKTNEFNIRDDEKEEKLLMEQAASKIQKPLPQIRRNFRETAFFYPGLLCNEKGEATLQFNAPESLNRWKFMTLAHNKDLKSGQIVRELTTQKEMMLVPNIPRFFREGDTTFFSTKIVNISGDSLKGTIELQFFNAENRQPLHAVAMQDNAVKNFGIAAQSGENIQWKFIVPSRINALLYRITATSEKYSDAEERTIPVLSNKMLITESLPIHINALEEKEIIFPELKESDDKSNREHHTLKLEISTNPSWYAILALPYIVEASVDCSEKIFNRYYANSMGQHIFNRNPEIQTLFENIQSPDTNAFLSNLQKNQDLKTILLEESPWLSEAKSESENMQQLSEFFKKEKMQAQMQSDFIRLKTLQLANGSWPWYKDMMGNRFISQHIFSGLARLLHLGIIDLQSQNQYIGLLSRTVQYLDAELLADFEESSKIPETKNEEARLQNIQIQYMYARSFVKNVFPPTEKIAKALNYFFDLEKKYWMKKTPYMQGMIALSMYREGETDIARLIIRSLKERAAYNAELGMYWELRTGYYWHQSPIARQALLIEAFAEIDKDTAAVEAMQQYLLKHKQTHSWNTPKATVEAVNALLQGETKVNKKSLPLLVHMDGKPVAMQVKNTAAGYYARTWQVEEITHAMGELRIENKNKHLAWGALYWQYFDELENIYPYKTPISIQKSLFVRKNTERGQILLPITEKNSLNTGDKIICRLRIHSDRAMEFVHVRDMRAAALEPQNVLSGYTRQGGLAYYMNTKDASTNFYFDYLPAGTHIIEYEMFASQKGSFSNGISQIQCMYAPEFTGHSKEIRITIK